MPIIVDKEKTRGDILKAFEECALSKPLSEISMRDIAKAAGISHSKILYYFSSKSELIVEYVRFVTNQYTGAYSKMFNESAENGNISIVDQAVNQIYDMPGGRAYEKMFLQIYAMAAYHPEIEAVVKETYKKWEDNIREGLAAICKKDMSEEAKGLFFLVEGLAMYVVNSNISKEEALKLIPNLIKLIEIDSER